MLLCRKNAAINQHVKTQNLVKHQSDTLTRDPTQPDPVKIADPVTHDPFPSLAHTYEQFLKLSVGLGLGLVFVSLFGF